MKDTDLSKKSFTELVKMYRDMEENNFSLGLNDKVVVEIGGRSITEYTVTTVGGNKDEVEADVIVLQNGNKKIVISKK